MKMPRTFVITAFALVALAAPMGSLLSLGESLDIIKVGKDIVITLAKAWDIVDDHYDFSEAPMPFIEKTERKLFRKMDLVQREMAQLNSEMHSVGTRTISEFVHYLPDQIKLELRLNDLLDYMTRLNVFYRNYLNYYLNHSDFERLTLEDFAKTVVSHSSGSVRSLVERIHAFVAPSEDSIIDNGVLRVIAKSLQLKFYLYLMVAALTCVNGRKLGPGPTAVDQLRQDFLVLEGELWSHVAGQEDNFIRESDKQKNAPEVRLIKKFQDFGDRIYKEFPQDVTHGLDALESVWIWARTYSELRALYALYESFRRFQNLQTAPGRVRSPPQAWADLAETVLNDNQSPVVQSEDRITQFIIKEKLFQEALKEVEGDMQCTTNQSPQQVLYNLYNAIALTELKGYMMMQFSYMLLKLYNKGNFTREAQTMRTRYEERTSTTIENIKSVMEGASRGLWKCDPKKHVKNETYLEVTQLLQGYVQNEIDLNPEGTCRETCSEYTYTKSHNCYKNLYCRQQRRCNGKIINCRFVDSDMWVCPADSFSGRRYEYIEYENGRILGRKQGCQKGTVKVDSWWRWLFWHCSYCFCLCDEQGMYSDRYFNMRSVIADIENNRVVTGLRFVKRNRIIHLQIQEGKLMPRGNIDVSTVRWAPVEDYKITDRNIFNGQDYHTLTWEHRSIDLDDLETDPGHLVTGIRFKKIGSHLNLEIFITPFDFETGQLIEPIERSIWKDNSNTDASFKNPRRQLHLNNPDVPIRSLAPSVPDSNSDQYIEFTHTDIDRDAAQTTVPFLDAQPVESMLPVPLGGAGIYHKGRRNFGGFIAPKIITYDFAPHVQNPVFEGEVEVNK